MTVAEQNKLAIIACAVIICYEATYSATITVKQFLVYTVID